LELPQHYCKIENKFKEKEPKEEQGDTAALIALIFVHPSQCTSGRKKLAKPVRRMNKDECCCVPLLFFWFFFFKFILYLVSGYSQKS
jgi:hypothetical protein